MRQLVRESRACALASFPCSGGLERKPSVCFQSKSAEQVVHLGALENTPSVNHPLLSSTLPSTHLFPDFLAALGPCCSVHFSLDLELVTPLSLTAVKRPQTIYDPSYHYRHPSSWTREIQPSFSLGASIPAFFRVHSLWTQDNKNIRSQVCARPIPPFLNQLLRASL